MRSFRIHWPAIIVAMLVSFLFSAGWFSYFKNPWMDGIGRSMDFFSQLPKWTVPVEFAVSLACSIVIAVVLSIAIQASGPQTVRRGVFCGALLWLGFVATTWAQEYAFEARPVKLYAIVTGYQLITMILAGAIVGGWKGKAPVA
jgi:hypothetical protein